MTDKRQTDDGLALKWGPVVAGALTAGLVVGFAEDRAGLAGTIALAIVVGLAAGGLLWGALKLLQQRR